MAPYHYTFLLMLVDFQLPLLLQPQSIDNGHRESEGLFWITMRAQSIDPSTGCRHMLYQIRRKYFGWVRFSNQENSCLTKGVCVLLSS